MSKTVLMIRNAAASDFGGAERMPVFIAKELEKYGLKPMILSRSKKLLSFAETQRVQYRKSWWWSQQDWSGWRAGLFVVYFFWQLTLCVYYFGAFLYLRPFVVSPQSKDDFIAATFAARLLGIKVFWIDHGDLKAIWMNHHIWYKNPIGKLVYLASKCTHSILVASKSESKLIEDAVPGSPVIKKFRVVYNGVFDNYTKSDKSIDFISTARLVTDKGIGELIDAFKKLSIKYPQATLAIVGDGPERSKFVKQAKGVKGITFYGHQENPLDYLKKSRIFVLPTHHEAFGVAVVEACMMGIPTVATSVGGIPEIITHEKSGLLIPAKDPSALHTAMEKLYIDQKLQEKLGAFARRQFLDRFELSEVVKNDYLLFYEGRRS